MATDEPDRGDDRSRTGSDDRLDHFFRHEYGRVVGSLVRAFGVENIDVAEEAVSEAMGRAVRSWRVTALPDDPAGWIARVARNHALDVLRRRGRWEDRVDGVRAEVVAEQSGVSHPEPALGGDIPDDTLRMTFLTCHSALSRNACVALTLKVVGGFGTDEIARAFFTPESTIAQRIVRAKKRLREVDARFELPDREDLDARLDVVLDVLYLVFNEGYTFRDEERILRKDLTDEAIRLVTALREHAIGSPARVRALLALMLLQSSRMDARVDEQGALLPLEEQDRSRWDPARIHAGLRELDEAGVGEEVSAFHLLAGIAACHATSPAHDATDWARIVDLYEMLLRVNLTPIVQLNHAVAVSMHEGPAIGLERIDAIAGLRPLVEHHLLEAARADCLRRLGRNPEARAAYARAAGQAPTTAERQFLLRRAG